MKAVKNYSTVASMIAPATLRMKERLNLGLSSYMVGKREFSLGFLIIMNKFRF